MGVAGRLIVGAAAAASLGGLTVAELAGPATVDAPAVRGPAAVRSFTVVAAGDILTENRVLANGAAAAAGDTAGARYDFGPLFAPIAPIVSGTDLAICHMEVPLGRPGDPVGAFGRSLVANRLLGPAEMAEGVAATGFDRCSTASNHSYDMGAAGVASTLEVFDAHGIGHVGTARTPAEAATGALPFTVNGVQVAHLAWSTSSNTALPEPWRFNYTTRTNPRPVADEIAAARAAGAEVVIVSVHIGREREHVPFPDDRAFVEAVVAAGADVVFEHGPHVVQGLEQVDGTWVFWSLGNLVSGMGEPGDQRYGPAARDGLLGWAEITVDETGAVSVTPAAIAVCNLQWTRTVWPAAARDDEATPADVVPQLIACRDRVTAHVPTAI